MSHEVGTPYTALYVIAQIIWHLLINNNCYRLGADKNNRVSYLYRYVCSMHQGFQTKHFRFLVLPIFPIWCYLVTNVGI